MASLMRKVVIIPARLASSRLPRKLLMELEGKSILYHVYLRAMAAKGIDAVYIATDSEEIQQHCREFTDNIVMTADTHQSGTDRIAEAAACIEADIIVNVQGDEPFIDPALISTIAEVLTEKQAVMSSAMQRITQESELLNPNVVKVVVNHKHQALYFSRSPIPYQRDRIGQSIKEEMTSNVTPYYHHIGIYGYTSAFLQHFSSLDMTTLESIEKLEQLRALEHGHTIQMIETDQDAFGIDTIEDYHHAQRKIKEIL